VRKEKSRKVRKEVVETGLIYFAIFACPRFAVFARNRTSIYILGVTSHDDFHDFNIQHYPAPSLPDDIPSPE
jgi:hypothetical protein